MTLEGESMRKLTKEVLDISKNAAFIGALRYFATKIDSPLLQVISFVLYGFLLMHMQSYISGPAFGEFLRDRFNIWPKVASKTGWALAFFITLGLVMLTDQTIERIALAQVR